MENEIIKEKIQNIWNGIKLSKATDLEHHLAILRQRVQRIIGNNEIQKIRHSSLLKLLIYELIVFADQKTSTSMIQKSTTRSADSSRTVEKSIRGFQRLEEIKELVCAMSQSTFGEIAVEVSKFKILLQRLKGLERELQRDEEQRRRASFNSSDSQGTEFMIQQLEDIIRRKENRIKQLNIELEENFNDKQQLEEQIDHLQLANCQLDAKVKQLQGGLARAQQHSRQLQLKLSQLGQEFDRFKQHEKEELLFGVNSFMNIEQPVKRQVEQSTRYDVPILTEPITHSTRMLYQYFQAPKVVEQEQTVKKKAIVKVTESQPQEDLLISLIPPSPQHKQLQNYDNCLERMLLMQALFIENMLDVK